MTTRVTIDFKDEPDVLAALRLRAANSRRSLGSQILFEALAALSTPTPPRPAKKKKEAKV